MENETSFLKRDFTFIIEDSSFVVSVFDPQDEFHNDGVQVLNYLKAIITYSTNSTKIDKNGIKIILPSLVLFETATTLLKKGIKVEEIEEKIWKLSHLTEISIIEIPSLFFTRICTSPEKIKPFKTSDLLICLTAIEYNGLILTFDKKMWQRVKEFYPYIYFCKKQEELKKFINELLCRGVSIPKNLLKI